MRIVVLFNLKPGVDRATYEAWARGTDIPGVNALASVDRFTIHRSTGLLGGAGNAPYDYIEVIDFPAMEPFIADISDPEFQKVAAAFGEFADDPKFIVTEDL